MSLT
ncbi:hypothetical protein CCH79_00017701 [Gambusia affinis]|jgi:hypothetical protein